MGQKFWQIWVVAGILGAIAITFILLAIMGLDGAKPATSPDPEPVAGEEAEEAPPEEIYDPLLDGTWSYSPGPEGPVNWGKIRSEFELCQTGTSQSPIDIRAFELVMERPLVSIGYGDAQLMVRVGSDRFSAVVENEHTFMLDGNTFRLDRIVIHSPAEHRLDGKQMPMEVQLQHQGAGGTLVLSLLLNAGPENPSLQPLIEAVGGYPDTPIVSASTNLATLLPGNLSYYLYKGSLTHPPCYENVSWLVFKEVGTVSRAQLASFQSVVKNNVRPIQSKSRDVEFYRLD